MQKVKYRAPINYNYTVIDGVTVVKKRENRMIVGTKILKPLPPTWNGQKWTRRLLHQMSTAELKRVLDIYGHVAIDAECKKNAALAAGGQS